MKLEKKIKVEKEGPNGVGSVMWFEYWNDSLFILIVNLKSGDFYRIAQRRKTKAYEENPSKWEIFLIKYDPQLNLLIEIEIKEFHSPISDYFIKDEKLWIRINIDDELGFVRINLP